MANTFLYYFAKTVTSTLTSDWRSYLQLIGSEGEEITPLSLLEVRSTITIKEVKTHSEATNEDDAWMAAAILSIYRMIRASQAEYRAAIWTRVTAQINALSANADPLSDPGDIYKGWLGNREFNTLVAAYDMFFHKFPMHPLSNIRIGTTGSRYRDCAALMSYGYLLSLLSMNRLVDLLGWVFVLKIGEDVNRMMKAGEELNAQDSYFPYQVDLGLVQKSSYSASVNPHFFQWVHFTGALLRSQRSMNARQISESNLNEIFANAACLAYTNARTFEAMQIYAVDDNILPPDQDDDDDGSPGNILQNLLKSRDPVVWIAHIRSQGGDLPGPVKKYVKKVGLSIKDPREGTIEACIAKLAAALPE